MPKIWNRRRELPGAWYMKRIAMVRKKLSGKFSGYLEYRAVFGTAWNRSVMIPVDAVRDSMNGDDGSADAISAG